MASRASTALRKLERCKYDYGPEAAAGKEQLLETLEKSRLTSAAAVLQLHELLCFLRAYPDTPAVRRLAGRMLGCFDQRSDLRRVRGQLVDSGVAGTELNFRFYWLTAIWLVHQGFGPSLTIDWKDFENRDKLTDLWHLLLPFTETAALDSLGLGPREWVERLKGPEETDAEFVIRRFDTLKVPIQVREKMYEDLDIPMTLAGATDTPARSREQWAMPVVYRKAPPESGRPDLKKVIRQSHFPVRRVPRREGRRLIDLANGCMVPRHRDLLIFLYADPDDVRLVDAGDGLQFACMGAVPERRLLLESVYGFLTILNGVPIGYVLCSAFFRSSEVAYNVFESFRGRGAAHVYGKVLAMVHQLFGAESFAVDPYQMGHGNEEGQRSGAWWFYYKLGFRPQDARVKALVRQELARMRKSATHRTSLAGLNDLASEYMFLQLGRERQDVLGQLSLGNMGAAAQQHLAKHHGADRERGVKECAAQVAELLGVRSTARWSPGERLAWERWAPLVLVLPEVARWSGTERKALVQVIRAKGGKHESDYVRLFDQHRKLQRALLRVPEA